jgi:gamma-glutamylcyclotransferase (GGCT)/AIG2-like uncharacterized protein YtfP
MLRIFVYGTLKRGQCRERSWPRKPLTVEPAWTPGRLYDLGNYPAMFAGDGRVLGELWQFAAEDMPETLRVLDNIEGFRDQPDDLYRRVVIECTTKAGDILVAHAFRYARSLPNGARIVAANTSGLCEWP